MDTTSRGLFVTATGTDVGKTYVSALILKQLREAGYDAGYYKAAISGIETDDHGAISSDASYVAGVAGLDEPHERLVSYTYRTAVSPHLAARLEGNPVDLDVVQRDYDRARTRHELVLVEGSGGIVCPLRWDGKRRLMLEDVVLKLGLGTVVVADAGLGTLNALATTTLYLAQRGIACHGILLNNYEAGNPLHEDNRLMARELTGIPTIACIPPGAQDLDCSAHYLASLFN